MKVSSLLVYALSSFLFFSCSNNSYNEDLLTQSQKALEENPHEALRLLNQIEGPESLPQGLYMQYIVSQFDAKFKCNQNIKNDSLILQACTYYKNSGNFQLGALAYLNGGRFYHSLNDQDKALEYYFLAENFAKIDGNNVLVAKILNNIATLYSSCALYSKAHKYYLEALNTHKTVPANQKLILSTIKGLVIALYKDKKYEEALTYIDEGITLAEHINDKGYLATFSHQYGYVYTELNNYTLAKRYLLDALRLSGNKEEILRINLNLALLYNKLKQPQEAARYISTIEKEVNSCKDDAIKASIYFSLSGYYKLLQDYEKVTKFIELEFDVRQKQNAALKQQELFEAETKIMTAANQERQDLRDQYFYIGSALSVLIAILLTYILVKHNHLRKQQALKFRLYQEQAQNDLLKVQASLENETQKSCNNQILGIDTFITFVHFAIELKTIQRNQNTKNKQQSTICAVDNAVWNFKHKLFEWFQNDMPEHAIMFKELEYVDMLVVIMCYYYIPCDQIALLLDIENIGIEIERIAITLEKVGVQEEVILELFYRLQAH